MTPAEIFMLANGYRLRQENDLHIVAWHACNVMNIHLKKKITVKKLLGKDRTMTPFDREKELEKLNKALSGRKDDY